MKYGESLFCVIYLVFACVVGTDVLRRAKGPVGRLVGAATLVLCAGDAFHLVPRVLSHFVAGSWDSWLGFGKLVTSVTMSVFYLLLYLLWRRLSHEDAGTLELVVYALIASRITLCLMPQNEWLTNDSPVLWSIMRNVPFCCLGAVVAGLWYRIRTIAPELAHVWLLITLSFAFYLPVALGAGLFPALGMLMMPKTVCYMVLIWRLRAFCLGGAVDART